MNNLFGINNLVEILPGLYLSILGNTNIYSENISNINNIITINNYIEPNENINVLNLQIDPSILYVKNKLSSNIIDYNQINNFIIESYKKNQNIVIYSDNLIVGLLICLHFIIKYINVNIIEALYYVSKKVNFNVNNLSKNQIFELFELYTKNI